MSTRTTVRVRQAVEGDLDQALALFHKFHEFHVRGVPNRLRVPHPYNDAAARETLLGILHNAEAALFVAEEGGRLLGLAEVYLRRDTPHPAAIEYAYGYLQSLIVTASIRRRGPGRQLVAAAEQVVSSGSIEPGNASIGPGSRQDFRLTSLGWTESRNVYVIYVGQDIRALEQQLTAANAHVAQLEQQLANMPAPAPAPADPKATEALAALVELAKALKLAAA